MLGTARMDLGLNGKVALVTGANRGIGAAIAMELAKEEAARKAARDAAKEATKKQQNNKRIYGQESMV